MGERTCPQQLLLDDLVIEILEHLPVKSLLRFKCVSRTWYNLIKSPAFINAHHLKERTNGTMMMTMSGPVTRSHTRYKVSSSIDIDVPLTLSFHDVDCPKLEKLWPNVSVPLFPDTNTSHWYLEPHILGPCEGLICIVRLGSAYICNPAMHQFKLLPECPFVEPIGCYPYGKGFFQLVSPDHWGFGTGSGNSFKVIRLQFISREYGAARVRKTHVEPSLYDSATDSWSQKTDSGMSLTFSESCSPNSELSLNGTCYWLIEPISEKQIPSVILSFEISTEIFRQFECPDKLRDSYEYDGTKNLMVQNECLAMFWFPFEESLPLEVWVMKEEYGNKECWTKHFVVEIYTWIRPLLFWKNGESLLMEGPENNEMISYDLNTGESKSFQFSEVEEILSAVVYKDSLISIN